MKQTRERTLALKMSEAEHEQIRRDANKMGLTMSAYVRFMLIGKPRKEESGNDGTGVQAE